MNYIIKLDFGLENSYYIRVHSDDNGWDEVFNPVVATRFSTREEAKDWIKKYCVMGKYTKVVTPDPQIKKFTAWANNGFVRRSFNSIDEFISRRYDPQKDDQIAVLNWWLAYNASNDTAIMDNYYKTWPKLFEIFENIFSVQAYHNNAKKDARYVTVEIYVTPTSDWNTFKKEFALIKDKCTLIDENGYRMFGIFEDDLSETRTPFLFYKNDNDVFIENTRVGHLGYYTSGTLKDAYKYIYKNLKYTV